MSADVVTQARQPWLFASLRGYKRNWLTKDVIAGLTVWAVLVPESLAYATIAGVSPVIGLYAAPAALVLYAAFGSSRHLVTGPMAATAALSAATVADVATSDDEFLTYTVVLALVTGAFALVAGLLRLGFVANFISEPVLKGFIIGLALTIIVGQLPKLFGIEGGEGNFFEKLWAWITNLDQTHMPTLIVGLISLAVVILCRQYLPRVPGPLLAVAFGILAVAWFGLDDRGVDIVGEIESGLPTLGLPDAEPDHYFAIAGAAAGVMLVGFAEGLGAAKTYATRHHYEIDANRELIGLGAANLGAGLSGGMVVNGSLSKTAVNGSAGAQSQMSGVVVAALTIITLLFLTGLFADLPEATLAAIVIAAIVELVDIDSMRELYRTYSERLGRIYGFAARPDFIGAIAAMLGVLIFDTLPGLFIGIITSILLMVYRSSRPNIAALGTSPGTNVYVDTDRHPDAVATPGVEILRVESGLFFANAEFVRTHIQALASKGGTRAVIIDAETIPFVDITSVRMLDELGENLATGGVRLALAKDIGQVRDLLPPVGGEGSVEVYDTIDEAVAAMTAAGSDI
jgi:high affinity sulfate transporter 1